MENNSVSEEILCGVKFRILDELRPELCRCLEPKEHFPYLISVDILSTDDCEEISHIPSRSQRANKLIDILKLKGPNSYDELCWSLQKNKTQRFLLEKLNKEYEERRRKLQVLLTPNLGKTDDVLSHVDESSLPGPNHFSNPSVFRPNIVGVQETSDYSSYNGSDSFTSLQSTDDNTLKL